MKKVIVFMLSVLMIFSLAACGSQDGGNQGTAPQSANGGNETENLQNPSEQVELPVKDTDGSSTETSEESVETTESKTLVVYYSATGYTESVAEYIAEATGGELFRLEPVEEYNSADLDWTDRNSRVSREHDNPEERMMDLVASTVPDWESYKTVFIGYPIWWGIAAWPVNDFVKNNDFTGKTVIPFCTSSSSGLGESGELLAEMAGTGDWQTGMRFSSNVSEADVAAWINGLSVQ